MGLDFFKEDSPKLPPPPKPGQQVKIEKGIKAHFLILAYLKRVSVLPQYQELTNAILKLFPTILEGWIGISMEMHNLYKMQRFQKNMSPRAFLLLLQFSQHMIQGLWKDEDPMLMVPHVDNDFLFRYKKVTKRLARFNEFIDMKEEEIKALNLFTETQLQDVNAFIKFFPRIKVYTEVVDSSKIVFTDII